MLNLGHFSGLFQGVGRGIAFSLPTKIQSFLREIKLILNSLLYEKLSIILFKLYFKFLRTKNNISLLLSNGFISKLSSLMSLSWNKFYPNDNGYYRHFRFNTNICMCCTHTARLLLLKLLHKCKYASIQYKGGI